MSTSSETRSSSKTTFYSKTTSSAVASPFTTRATAALVLSMSLLAATAAFAGDCNTDIGALSQKRQGFIDKLNVLAKAAKGKLDPVASCPTLRGLVSSEGGLLKYLEANKNWCNVPDDTGGQPEGGKRQVAEFRDPGLQPGRAGQEAAEAGNHQRHARGRDPKAADRSALIRTWRARRPW